MDNAGINPSELSRRANFRSRNYTHRLLNGTRGSNVSAQTLTGLATALRVEPADLLMAEDDDPKVSPAPAPEPEPAVQSPPDEPENPEAWRWG